VAAVRKLIEAGADREAIDQSNRRPLHLALALGRERTAAALIAAGADVNAIGASPGETPLFLASAHPLPETLAALVAAGAAAAGTDAEGRSAAFYAAMFGLYPGDKVIEDKSHLQEQEKIGR